MPRREMIPSARTHHDPDLGWFCSLRCMNNFETELVFPSTYIRNCRWNLVELANREGVLPPDILRE